MQSLATVANGDKEDRVDEILKAKAVQGETKVLVKWTGSARPTWEPLENIGHDRSRQI